MKRTFLIVAAIVVFGTNLISANNCPNPVTVNPVIPASYKVNITKIKLVNPFCLAIVEGDFDMVKKLIEMGTDVNELSHKKTPLMYAARYNRAEIAKLLIANGAKTDKKDARGQTALKYAELSNADTVVLLLQNLEKEKKS